MSIFGHTSTELEVPVIEGYNVENNGDLIAIQEASADYYEINKAIHALEMEELAMERSNDYEGSEVVLEKLGGNVLQKIKKFFVDFAAKIKSYLLALVAAFEALFRGGEGFIKKYEEVIKKRDTKGLKVKLHKYENLDFHKGVNKEVKVSDEIKNLIAESGKVAASADEAKVKELADKVAAGRDNKEEGLAEMRGAMVGKGKLTKQEYSEELYAYFRAGVHPKHGAPEVEFDLATVAANLKDSKVVKDVKKAQNDFNKTTSEMVKAVDSAIKSIEKSSKNAKEGATVKVGEHEVKSSSVSVAIDSLRLASAATKNSKAISLEALRALKSALAERTNASKAACMKALTYKQKKD